MSGGLVVDTDVISYIVKGDTRGAEFERRMEGHHWVASFMNVAELERWSLARNWAAPRWRRMKSVLRRYVIHFPDESACRIWAEVMHAAARAGRPMSSQDAWIATAALAYNCPLLTDNAKDFDSVPGLRLMPVE